MLFATLLTLLPFLSFTLALPAASPAGPDPETVDAPNSTISSDNMTSTAPAHWVISNLLINIGQDSQSAFFHFRDTDPELSIDMDCRIEAPVFKSKFVPCDGKTNLFVQMKENVIVLKRAMGGAVTGTAPQSTHWTEGEGGNLTTSPDGVKTYSRSDNWYFPVMSVVGKKGRGVAAPVLVAETLV